MILADLGPALPYIPAGLAGLLAGVTVGRVDWNQRVSYWRQRALSKPGPQPPPAAPALAVPPVRLVVPTRNTATDDTRTDAA